MRAEAERLSRLAEVDWQYQIKGRAKHFDVEPTVLRNMVVALLKERDNQIKREKAEDQAREKQRLADQKEERERQREQERADKEAQRKHQEKDKEFTKLSKLPRTEHEARLTELAKRFGEDLAVLREEFEAFGGESRLVICWPHQRFRRPGMSRPGTSRSTPHCF